MNLNSQAQITPQSAFSAIPFPVYDLAPIDHGMFGRLSTPQMADTAPTIEPWRARLRRAVAPFGQLSEIARAAGMSATQLQKIANGTTKDPSVSTLDRIARALQITIAELVSDDTDQSQSAPSVNPPSPETMSHLVTTPGVDSASQAHTGGTGERTSDAISDLKARIADLLEDKRAYRVAIFDLSERLRVLTHSAARTDVSSSTTRKSKTR